MTYRWGYSSFLKLTSSTLKGFEAGLPHSDLPQAFQDAIAITRTLGIRYLWIDALCILQDSQEDFNRESAEMSEIYINSTCNIIAAFGADPHTSLFSTRSSIQLGTFKPTWDTTETDTGFLSFFDTVVVEETWRKQFQMHEITTRGWIFQEFLLASRALCFGKDQVHWICSSEASEIWPKGNPGPIGLGTKNPPLVDQNGHIYLHMWNSLVEKYSTLDLSMAGDRLVAISGVAKFYQRKLNVEYFAGHWASNLAESLLWTTVDAENEIDSNIDQLRPYIAPSWSWASVNKAIKVSRFSMYATITCKVSGVKLKLAGDDPTGKLTRGDLILEALAVRVQATNTGRLQLEDGTPLNSGKWRQEQLSWDAGPPPTGTRVDLAIMTANVLTTDGTFYLAFPWFWELQGLMLLPTATGDGSHVRIGTFEIHDGSKKAGVAVPSELTNLGLGFRRYGKPDGSHLGKCFVEDETKIRTFTIP
jgi:hypothetical protein